MPFEGQPGPPRVVFDGIEGGDTLYEFDLPAAPDREPAANLHAFWA
jgi:hypothetical protein